MAGWLKKSFKKNKGKKEVSLEASPSIDFVEEEETLESEQQDKSSPSDTQSKHKSSSSKRPPSSKGSAHVLSPLSKFAVFRASISRTRVDEDKFDFYHYQNDMSLVIGLAGGSGSGKTTIANLLIKNFDPQYINLITHDCYYHDLRHLSMEERAKVNFDHPASLDTALLIEHIKQLKRGESCKVPEYDYATHGRAEGQERILKPTRILIVEGILLYENKELRELLDIKIFVDTAADIRFIRRLKRDIAERGREVGDVTEQYLSTVRPMHEEFVEPSKRYADVIIPEGGFDSTIAMDMIVSRMNQEVVDMRADPMRLAL